MEFAHYKCCIIIIIIIIIINFLLTKKTLILKEVSYRFFCFEFEHH